MESRGGEVMSVAVLFFVLTWLTVALRVYTRAWMLKTFGKDDWYMLATLTVFTLYLASQITAVTYGTGRHIQDLEPSHARIALMFSYFCELLYVLSNCTLKIALGNFYLRVAIQRWHVWCLNFMIVGTAFLSSCYFFVVMLQCIPISGFWKVHPATNRCIPKAPTTGITYALGVVNASADWMFGILPLFIVFGLQMPMNSKIMVMCILAFAAVGSTATIVRMLYIHTLTNGEDFLWATTDIAIWSTVEPGIGIIASSIATLRPLLQTYLWRLGLAAQPMSTQRRNSVTCDIPRQNRPSRPHIAHGIGLTDLEPDEDSTYTLVSRPAKPDKGKLRSKGRLVAEEEDGKNLTAENVITTTTVVEYADQGPSHGQKP